MTCPTCGFQGNEAGDHRCGRCGRRLETPAAHATPPITTAAAPALDPEWKQEVSHKLEEFRRSRGQQQKLFDEEATPEVTPPPDRTRKVLPFEDFAAAKIEPVVVPPPAPETLGVPRDIRCEEPVAPVALRALAGFLDGAVLLIAAGLFAATFHQLGGGLPTNAKGLTGLGSAAGVVGAFYLFVYLFYGGETPGMQWTGLRVLDFGGNAPRTGARLARALGALLSAAALGLGYLWALIDEERLTWHDRMSQTFLTRDDRAGRRFQSR
jgi:uncharacterized RDD family membrane protein YckC